jgi:hypothetical protein
VGNLSKKAWLCYICWDRKVIHPLGLSSTTPAVNHLKAKHRLNSDGPIKDSTPSVVKQLHNGTNVTNIEPIFTKHLVTQSDVNKFKQALLR